MTSKQKQTILDLAREEGFIRAWEVRDHKINSRVLNRMVDEGMLIRAARGIYRLKDATDTSAFHGFALIAKKNPASVICLLSALSYHEMTSQSPFQVWISIGYKAWFPKINEIPVRVFRTAEKYQTMGVSEYWIEGVTVKITNPVRTVADCFKYRNTIGLDIALEALKDGLRDRRFTIDELFQYAQFCRVGKIIKPYIEALV